MDIHAYCGWTVVLLCFFKFTQCQLTIPVAQTKGSDTTCLKTTPITPCQTLKYVLHYVLSSNESAVDITFVEDYRYLVFQPLQIHTNLALKLRFFSKLPERNINLTCATGHANRIFDVYGPNLMLEFYNITFANCKLLNVSVNVPVVSVNDTKKVSLYSCVFQDNSCGAFYAINSDIYIEYSLFQRNSIIEKMPQLPPPYNVSTFSGGVGLLFQNERRNTSVSVVHTRFLHNRVHVDDSKYYIASPKEQNFVRNGGAMHVTFIDKSTFWTKITITSCYFEGNNATRGGALLIELFGKSSYSKYNGFCFSPGKSLATKSSYIEILIESTQFLSNYGSQAGGAFLLSTLDYLAKTGLTMVDTIFQENLSKSGGAIYILLQSPYKSKEIQKIFLFKRVQVIGNKGFVASSVKIASHIFSPRTMCQVPTFEDCSFINNKNPSLNGYAYLASFIVDRVNILFNGTNKFIGNRDFGAVYLSNANIEVHGKLHFLNNSGLQGGAISMQNSQIVVHPGSDLLFQDNYAVLGGGAINVATNTVYHIGVIRNPFCFLIYSEYRNVHPNQWNVSIGWYRLIDIPLRPVITSYSHVCLTLITYK